MAKIVCPICDEELGNKPEDVPEKCPICDTRKHEILQEIRDKQEEKNGQKVTTFMVADAPSEVLSAAAIAEKYAQVVVEEENIGKAEEKEESVFIPSSEEEEKGDLVLQNLLQKADKEDNVFAESDSMQDASEEFALEDSEETSLKFAREKNEAILQGFAPTREAKKSEEDVAFERPNEAIQEVEEMTPPLRVAEDASLLAPKAVAPVEKKEKEGPPQPYKSGSSSLETLPAGFQYCPSCKAIYPKASPRRVCEECTQTPLKMVEKGFPPGHYLVLYNHDKKAISYFQLEAHGSIFIGRSSERGSSKDIDLSIAWKNYYQKNATNPDDFKDKMTLLKGISRKHAIIRFSPEDKTYILFHLSEKNYTLIQSPNGTKRIREPKNRNKIELQPGSLISLGNQKEFIILRYKIIELEGA